MTDCRKCRDWRGCLGKAWYSYADIAWCREQVFWLLKHAEELSAGQWPTPDATADPPVRGKAMSTEAPFTKAIRIIAEVQYRLARTGWRGRLLVEQCINREKMLYLDDDAKDALYYVSGWSRKDRDFNAWLRDRKYHRKSDKNVVMTGI